MKRIICCLLCALLLSGGLWPGVVASAQESGFVYLVEDGKATIIEYEGEMPDYLEIPATLGGYPVTSIGSGAFASGSMISVVLPVGLERIGSKAFASCRNLIGVNFPYTLRVIESNAFYNCGLYVVELNPALETLEEGAFSSCGHLWSFSLYDYIKNITGAPASGCNKNLQINLLEWDRTETPKYRMEERCLISSDGVLVQALEYADVPWEGITAIGNYAFAYQNSRFMDLVIPEGVKSIGRGAFLNTLVRTVQFPEGLETIGPRAFASCYHLTAITLPNGLRSIERGAFNDCENLETVSFPQGLERIEDTAFENSGLREVHLPEGLTHLGQYAFSTCLSMEKLTLPSTLKVLGKLVFVNAFALKELVIPEGMEELEMQAFTQTKALESISLPSTLTKIDVYGLNKREMPSLKTVTVAEGNSKFRSNGSCLYTTDGKLLCCWAYTELPEGITAIAGRAFEGCAWEGDFTVPDSVTEIGVYAFGFSAVGDVIIPDSVETVGVMLFYSCANASSVTVHCEAEEKPAGWSENWAGLANVVWGYGSTPPLEDPPEESLPPEESTFTDPSPEGEPSEEPEKSEESSVPPASQGTSVQESSLLDGDSSREPSSAPRGEIPWGWIFAAGAMLLAVVFVILGRKKR